MLKTGVPKLFIMTARQRSGDNGPYCPSRPRSTMLSGRTAAVLARSPPVSHQPCAALIVATGQKAAPSVLVAW